MDHQTPVYQLFIKQLNGKTLNLKFTSPSLQSQALITHLQTLTLIPNQTHLLTNHSIIQPHTTLHADPITRFFPSITLWTGLLGGKGGFGSLLRGAATKAGQKKTNNFDACRDMSGRRLRHVNAEKRLEEWKEGEDERRLEKLAEEFLKKKAKSVKGSVKGGDAEKYVAKYREESAKCVKEVEEAVREAFEREKKRKGGVGNGSSDAKKLKIWLGKRKVDENDDMEDDSSDEEDGKSAVINNQESPNKGHDSTSSVSDGGIDGDSSGGSPLVGVENNDTVGIVGPPEEVDHIHIINQVEHVDDSTLDNYVTHSDDSKLDNVEVDTVGTGLSIEDRAVQTNVLSQDVFKAEVTATTTTEAISTVVDDSPINFDDYITAAEMEVLGMDRLKTELQTRGLKCGGTLQERAARLFLLKTTPIEKLPKKLLVKK